MNERYVRTCCMNYAENKARLFEINEKLSHYGSLTQNFSDEKGGYGPLSKSEKSFLSREKLREQRKLVIKQIRVVEAAANLEPVIHMRTREGISSRRFAEIYNTTHWDARKQFDRAIRRYVEKVNGK